MAMTLRLSDAETDALRRRAERESRSMQEVARQAVREYVENDELFIANYSDGLTDHHLPDMIDHVRNTGAVGGFLAVRPPDVRSP